MGNLYTQLVKMRNPRVEILTKLKYAWKARPLDMNYIRRLQNQLKELEKRELQKITKKEIKRYKR